MVKRKSGEPFFKEPRKFPARDVKGFPIGPRTKERQKQNAVLNKLPPHIKKHCEIKIPGVCVKTIMLTWAHSKRSRFILTDKDWQEAARACQPCHQYIDDRGHAFMHRAVTEAISKRKL
jgi:hypothetical protein